LNALNGMQTNKEVIFSVALKPMPFAAQWSRPAWRGGRGTRRSAHMLNSSFSAKGKHRAAALEWSGFGYSSRGLANSMRERFCPKRDTHVSIVKTYIPRDLVQIMEGQIDSHNRFGISASRATRRRLPWMQ
jgi:hypothetical protein